MAIPNPIEAIVAYLAADAEVTTQVGAKVYGAELPQSETPNMPQKCLVVSPAGGSGGGFSGSSYLPLMRLRVDLRAYGDTPFNAWPVYLAAYDALKNMNRVVQGTVILGNAIVSGGPVQLRDADLDWPLLVGSFEVTAAEIAAA